jgi:WD40 repeat protein
MRFLIQTSDYVNGISVHPDGKRVAAAMSGGIAAVFSVATGDSLFKLSGHGARSGVRTIAYGPHGKRLATGALFNRLNDGLR